MTVLARIDDRGCGCDVVDPQGRLVSMDTAIARIRENAAPVMDTHEMALVAATGRVLARDVRARLAAPPFDNAAMDGYALNSADLVGPGPWRLPVTARIAAGQACPDAIAKGKAAQIFTGAPVPSGADAVVMQEHVAHRGDAILVTRAVTPGTNIRYAGEDMAPGEVAIPAGRRLTARDIAAGAAAGAARIDVRRRVRVALLVTGDEVQGAGQARGDAGIWDVNSPMLMAALASEGVELVHVQSGKDNRDALRAQLRDLAADVDLVVTTGGISVGGEDHVKPALSDLGGSIIFSGVAMKPGKPVSYGRLGGTHWLGLPGNPLSAYVTWQVFGTLLCQNLAGDTSPRNRRRNVVLSRSLQHRGHRCELRLCRIAGFDGTGREVIHFDDAIHSGRVACLSEADGLFLIPAEIDNLPEGALVEYLPFCDC